MIRLAKAMYLVLLAGTGLGLVAADRKDNHDAAMTVRGRQLQQRLPCQQSLFGRDIITGNCIPSEQRSGNRQGGRFWFRRHRPPGQRNSQRKRRMMRMMRQGNMNARGGNRCQGINCPVNRHGNRSRTPDCSSAPSRSPTAARSRPTTSYPTYMPSPAPTKSPSSAPVTPRTPAPSYPPTYSPTSAPSARPSVPARARVTARPTNSPSRSPSSSPSAARTNNPTRTPTRAPTRLPTRTPTRAPTRAQTPAPSISPSATPTYTPSAQPSPRSRSGPVVCCADAANNYYGRFDGAVVPQDTNAFGPFNVTVIYAANGITWQSSTGCGNSNPDSNIDLVIQRGILSWTQVLDYGYTAGGFCNSNLTTSLVQGVDFWQLVGLDQGKQIMLGQLNFTCL